MGCDKEVARSGIRCGEVFPIHNEDVEFLGCQKRLSDPSHLIHVYRGNHVIPSTPQCHV